MFTIISYDIANDKRRTRVLKLLKGYGTRVQYSVFECDLSTTQRAQVQRELADRIEPSFDSVRIYVLDTSAVTRIQIMGLGRVSTEPGYYVI